MKLTPALLEATYNFLCETPPFRKWRLLPDGSKVSFTVVKDKKVRGYQRGRVIGISEGCIGRVDALIATMAHEMIHLYQAEKKTATRAEHNAEFNRLAKIVCRHHGYDPLLF